MFFFISEKSICLKICKICLVILQSLKHFEFFFFGLPFYLNGFKFLLDISVIFLKKMLIFFIVDNIQHFDDDSLLFAIFINFLLTLISGFVFGIEELLGIRRLILLSQIKVELQSFIFLFEFDFLLFKLFNFRSHTRLFDFKQIFVNIEGFACIFHSYCFIFTSRLVYCLISTFALFFWQLIKQLDVDVDVDLTSWEFVTFQIQNGFHS